MPEVKHKLLAPRHARKDSDLIRLERTCASLKKSWFMLCHNGIAIHNQEDGKTATGQVFLTRREFETFVRFYERGQRCQK
jgi:hypothetical protein